MATHSHSLDFASEEANAAFEAILEAAAAAGECDRNSAVLTQHEFRIGAAHLGLDYLRLAEVHRIWKRLHGGQKVPQCKAISKDDFSNAASRNESLRSLLVQILARVESRHFKVPENYDWSKPTCKNYEETSSVFCGPYAEIRDGGKPPEKRDYSYHNNYLKERQEWQDHIIRLTITRHAPQPRPWVVFTCGAMGCGKGRCHRIWPKSVTPKELLLLMIAVLAIEHGHR